MEVKEFVKTILKSVTEAVAESKEESEKYNFYLPDTTKDAIDFDLAIVVKKGAEGKIGAEIFSVVGAKAQGNISEEIVNRIKFRVQAFTK